MNNKITQDKLSNCIQWSIENGANIDDNVQFCIDDNIGLSAFVKDSSKINDQSLIDIPSKLLITYKQALTHFNSSNSEIEWLKNPNALTQLYLCKLKFSGKEDISEKHVFYKPYQDILPLKLNQPYFWSSDELALIKQSDLFVVIKQNLKSLAIEWFDLLSNLNIEPAADKFSSLIKTYPSLTDANGENEIMDTIFEYIQSSALCSNDNLNLPWNSFIAYLWAFCIFNSRAFPEILINSNDCSNINQAFLLPIIDLLNHKNGTKVKWGFTDDNVTFSTSKINFKDQKDIQLFNNYGDKSNEELLLGYGFVQEDNQHDNSRLTLRLEDQLINNSMKYGVNLTKENLLTKGCVQFIISFTEPLPKNLVNLFGFLCKLSSEEKIMNRAILEGTDELNSILYTKLESFKSLIKKVNQSKIDSDIKKSLKVILNSQRKIFNQSIEALAKLQKSIIKKIPQQQMISLKTIFKSDKTFANALLLIFGVIKFEDMIAKDCLNQAMLLWILRVSNKDSLTRKLDYQVPKFILETFEDVSKNIVVQKDDVSEYMDFYKSLFPHLSDKIPDVFAQGNWGIKQFIIADSVIDRIVWIRKSNQEPFFLEETEFQNKDL